MIFWIIANRCQIYMFSNLSIYNSNGVKSDLQHTQKEVRVTVFNATFNNISVISWRSVLLVEETGVPGENHRPASSHWQTWLHYIVPSTPDHLSRNVVNFGYILIRIVGVLAPINFKILFWLRAYLIQRLLKKHIVYTQLDIKVLITLKTYNKYWVSDCRLTPYEHSYIMTRTNYIQWKDDDVCFVLASLDLYSARSMEQTVCR